jgi:hypothetical protein
MSADQTPHSVHRVVFVLFVVSLVSFPLLQMSQTLQQQQQHHNLLPRQSLAKYTHWYDDRHTYTKCNCHCSCALLVLSSEWSVHSSFRAATWHRSFDQNCDSHLAGRWMDIMLWCRLCVRWKGNILKRQVKGDQNHHKLKNRRSKAPLRWLLQDVCAALRVLTRACPHGFWKQTLDDFYHVEERSHFGSCNSIHAH